MPFYESKERTCIGESNLVNLQSEKQRRRRLPQGGGDTSAESLDQGTTPTGNDQATWVLHNGNVKEHIFLFFV